ncbi:hypothetical protein HME9304_03356 [Flagellimonas maritima]|uniref:SGNH/GDSL hydrolase family protein n=1 Tax=Flagellimonas maritima TaxID=1383885 RepID=A0A2Z4LX76_9FLAO|nr:hypothetical protein HME9304_03356 [Allomuricauda aurantiaca]
MKKSWFFLLVVFTFQVIYPQDFPINLPPKISKGLKVLFIGNSLTYSNNLPKLVKKEIRSKGINLKTEMIAYPNYAIEDHWNDGKVQKLIAKNHYDFVIIQQGPSSQEEGRNMLLSYGKKLKQLCESKNSQLVYFMVWPSRTYYHTFDDVITNHREAALKNGALLSSVGEEWKGYFDGTGDYSYYAKDGFHPSIKGSKVAAKIISQTLLKVKK